MSPRLRDLLPVVGLGLVLLALAIYVAVSGVGGSGGGGTASSPLPSAEVQPGSSTPPLVTPTVSPSTPAPPTLPACLAPSRVTVLTFNIHGGRHPDDTLDLARVEAEIKASKADIVLLQEVHDGMYVTGFVDEPAVLGKALGMYTAFGVNLLSQEPGGRPEGRFGTLVLSRYPIVSSTNTLLPHPAGTQQRGLLHVVVSVAGVRLDVWNTHLDNSSATARFEQIKAIRQLIAPVDGTRDQPTHAMIFGGDLNASGDSAVARIARGFARDTWSEIGSGPGYTVPEWAPRNRIDFLFHDTRLVPRAVQVLPSGVSDHRSLWAAYDLYSRADCG